MRRHPSLGVEYEVVDIVDQGPGQLDGTRLVAFVVAFVAADELRVLTLHRVIDAAVLERMQHELRA